MTRNTYTQIMAMMMMYGASPFALSQTEYQHLSEAEKHDLEEQVKAKYKSIMLKKGLKEYTIGGITVLALNEKNAIRKASKVKEQLKTIEK